MKGYISVWGQKFNFRAVKGLRLSHKPADDHPPAAFRPPGQGEISQVTDCIIGLDGLVSVLDERFIHRLDRLEGRSQ